MTTGEEGKTRLTATADRAVNSLAGWRATACTSAPVNDDCRRDAREWMKPNFYEAIGGSRGDLQKCSPLRGERRKKRVAYVTGRRRTNLHSAT